MRQVYTSPRLENVEAVAALLQEHGIETRIVNGRSYRGGIRGDFSYRKRPERGEEPSVWVVRSEDRPRARELLREEGLIQETRGQNGRDSYLPELRFADSEDKPRRRGFGLRSILLLAAVVAVGIGLFGRRESTDDTKAADIGADAAGTANAAAIDTYRIDIPPALAAMLIDAELQAQGAAEACLSVDGRPPGANVLGQLRNEARVRLRPAKDCAAASTPGVTSIALSDYLTDGSGKGTVRLQIADTDAEGRPRSDARTLEVRRVELQWEVTGVRL